MHNQIYILFFRIGLSRVSKNAAQQKFKKRNSESYPARRVASRASRRAKMTSYCPKACQRKTYAVCETA